jgi:hypothetical protein
MASWVDVMWFFLLCEAVTWFLLFQSLMLPPPQWASCSILTTTSSCGVTSPDSYHLFNLTHERRVVGADSQEAKNANCSLWSIYHSAFKVWSHRMAEHQSQKQLSQIAWRCEWLDVSIETGSQSYAQHFGNTLFRPFFATSRFDTRNKNNRSRFDKKRVCYPGGHSETRLV